MTVSLEAWAFAAALASAALHASWNAAVKADADPARTMAAQMVMSGLLALPALPLLPWPDAAAWPWMVAATLLNLVAVQALVRAYAAGGFGVVYALVRATSVLLVAPLAAALVGEQPGPWAALGIVLVCTALAVLGVGGGTVLPRRALPWTLLSGAMTAATVICDARGVRSAGDAWGFAAVMTVVNALGMALLGRLGARPWVALAARWRKVLPMSTAAIVSYALILWAYAHAPVARSAALRDTSAVFGLVIAAWWLKEPLTRQRLAVVGLALAGVICLRLG